MRKLWWWVAAGVLLLLVAVATAVVAIRMKRDHFQGQSNVFDGHYQLAAGIPSYDQMEYTPMGLLHAREG